MAQKIWDANQDNGDFAKQVGSKDQITVANDGTATITYTDGSSDTIPGTDLVVAKDEAGRYNLQGGKITVDKRTTLTPAQAQAAVVNNADLPSDAQYSWAKTPDLTTAGDKSGQVTVTYADGSKTTVDVTVHVNTDAETYDPIANQDRQQLSIQTGNKPDVNQAVNPTDRNGKQLPDGTQFAWVNEQEPDTDVKFKEGKTSRNVPGTVKVTYPDGTNDTVTIQFNVIKDPLQNKQYKVAANPDAKTSINRAGALVDAKGQELTGRQDQKALNNTVIVTNSTTQATGLPDGAAVEWVAKPDLSKAKPGADVKGTVRVAYGDNSTSAEVEITVHYQGQNELYQLADKGGTKVNQEGQLVDNQGKALEKQDFGQTLTVTDPTDQAPKTLPAGTTVTRVDHNKLTPGSDATIQVQATYPDGSQSAPVNVKVHVLPSQADVIDLQTPEDKLPVDDPTKLTTADKVR